MAFICELVFLCLCFLCFGLVHDLNWFLIDSRSFRLLIHLVSSPNDVAMLLFVLINWVVFVVIFRDEFSPIYQSFKVIFVHEEVTVSNLKTDSNSEFGCPNTAEECERCAGEAPWPLGLGMATPCGGRVTHCQTSPLVPCGPCAPHGGEADVASFYWSKSFPLSLPFKYFHSLQFLSKKKSLKLSHQNFLSTFSHLPNTITFSYEVRIGWFKLEIVRNQLL